MERGKVVLILVAVFVAAAGAEVWPPSLVSSFAAPPNAVDVAYELQSLYVLIDTSPAAVCKLTTNGSLVSSFGLTIPTPLRGLTYDGQSFSCFFASNRSNGYVYRLSTTGSLAGAFPCPGGVPFGLGFTDTSGPHGTGLFAACRDSGYIARLDKDTGSLLGTFAGPASGVVAYDDYFAGVRDSNDVYWDYYTSWQVFDTMPARPMGIAAGVDLPTYDQFLRVFILCQNGYIYFYEGATAVAPASLGRVKALYR